MVKRLLTSVVPVLALVAEAAPCAPWLDWQPAEIRIGNDRDGFLDVVKGRRMMNDTKLSGGTMNLPYFAWDEDEGRLLFIVSDSGYKGGTYLMESRDEGETWKVLETGGDSFAGAYGLVCCGHGVMLAQDALLRSTDGGKTWKRSNRVKDPRFPEKIYGWDPPLVIKGSDGKHILQTGYYCKNFEYMYQQTQPVLRESTDAGETWTAWRGIPEFGIASEIALGYNAKGEILAGIRRAVVSGAVADDHYSQLLTSVSRDGGKTWLSPKVAAGCGRHHPCFALLPDGRVVLTYVVRLGYPKEDGKFAYGVEAVISYDDGQTWDTDHRYILAKWTSDCVFTNAAGEKVALQHYMGQPQCTATAYLPKSGELITAYGTGRDWKTIDEKGRHKFFRVGVVRWKPMDRAAYTKERAPVPAPIPAEAAHAALRGNPEWAIRYSAKLGLPDGGWVCHYARPQLALTNGFLRIDHRHKNHQLFTFRGPDLFETMNRTYGLRTKLRIPSCANDEAAGRLIIYGVVDTGPEKNGFSVFIDRKFELTGAFGPVQLPAKPDEPFTLEIWADKPSRTARIWVDGKLVSERPFEPKYLPPETGPSLYFGSGSKGVGGVIDIGYIQFGGVE